MRLENAIQFVPELVGDIAHVLSLSKNRTQFLIETSLETLETACSVFHLIALRKYNRESNTLLNQVEQQNRDEFARHIEQLREENIARMKKDYEKTKLEVEKGEKTDDIFRAFLSLLQENLKTVVSGIESMDIDSEDQFWDQVQELHRCVLRDYTRNLKYISEEAI